MASGQAAMGMGYYMKRKTLMVYGVTALLVGLVGLTVVTVAPWGSFSSPGQRIYYTGADAAGPISRSVAGGFFMGPGMLGDVACVNCHGEDGRGGRIGMMLGSVDIPDIRYATLTTARSEDGTTVPAWTDSDIARAIRDGIEPNDQRLKAPMPRWSMTDTDITDVIAYLKELSRR